MSRRVVDRRGVRRGAYAEHNIGPLRHRFDFDVIDRQQRRLFDVDPVDAARVAALQKGRTEEHSLPPSHEQLLAERKKNNQFLLNPTVDLQAPFEKVLREERIHDAAVLVRTRELMKDKKAQKKAAKQERREEKRLEEERAERLRTIKRPAGYDDEKTVWGTRRPPKEAPAAFVSPEEIAAKFEALAQKRGRAKATKQFFEEPPTLEELEEQYAQVIMIESGGGFMAKKDVDFYHTGHLCNAVANADASRTKALLDVGLDGTTLDIKDGEPLFLKCVRNQLEVDAGKMKVPKFERSLQDAVMLVSGDFVKTAELLLQAKSRPDDVDRLEDPGVAKGWGPIHYAIDEGNLERTLWLMDLGASIDLPTDTGVTPLMMATRKGDLKMMLFLLQSEAEMEVVDSKGRTALHEAARVSSMDACEVLLKAGALKDSIDRDLKRPDELASKRGWKKMAQ